MRRGFTLIELLLVSALLAVLFGIVWGMTSTLLRSETIRKKISEQQQIARTWKEIFDDDFRSVIQDTEQLNKAVGDETIRHFGVDGTATRLRIDIADYSWRTDKSSELRTIFYEFHPNSGLVRRERDYAALKSVEGALQAVPEIVSGTFRYFDGSSWSDEWSSLDRKRAPSSIEVTFYFLTYTEAKQWRLGMPGTTAPTMSQVVVQVPAAAEGYFEAYRRAQPPAPPQPPPSPSPSPPRPAAPPPPSPFHSLFGDD